MAKNLGGRPTIFGPKSATCRYQGTTTTAGSKQFEKKRKELAVLAGWPVEKVGDGDVFEYLAIGEAATRKHLGK